jgi:protein-S-isoprenylcysteine O-methyltransferase Ste14
MVDPSLTERIFVWVSAALFSIFTIIRVITRRKIKRYQTKIAYQKGGDALKYLIILEFMMYFLYILDVIVDPLSNYFQIQLPLWLRWFGVGMFASADILFIWIHRHLGPNFFSTLKLRENHELIVSGPYKRIRHPMYSAFYMWHIGMFLISANWLIGVVWISGLTILVIYRVKREEKMMLEKFGTKYEDHIQNTYRFFPKFLKNNLK